MKALRRVAAREEMSCGPIEAQAESLYRMRAKGYNGHFINRKKDEVNDLGQVQNLNLR